MFYKRKNGTIYKAETLLTDEYVTRRGIRILQMSGIENRARTIQNRNACETRILQTSGIKCVRYRNGTRARRVVYKQAESSAYDTETERVRCYAARESEIAERGLRRFSD